MHVIGDPSQGGSVWVILVCGLYGSLIGLMIRSGGTFKFGDWALERIKTQRGALMGAWVLGLAIFLDDYLSALTVGLSMRKITDAFKVPRSMLAYIVNTTAAPWCVVVPISTWTIFVAALLRIIGRGSKRSGAFNVLENDPVCCLRLYFCINHPAFYLRNSSMVW